jgi:hypothetical protein
MLSKLSTSRLGDVFHRKARGSSGFDCECQQVIHAAALGGPP